MNLELNEKKLSCKYDYCIGKVGDLADPSLHVKTQDYRRRLSGKMRAMSPQDVYNIPKAKNYFVTRKYDGEFTMAFFDGKRLISINPGGTVRLGLPAFTEAEKLLKKAKVESCIVAGELYVKEDPSRAHMVQQVVGILRSPKAKSEIERIGFAVFDIVEWEGDEITAAAKVFDQIKKAFGKGDLVHPAEVKKVDTVDAVMEVFTDWVIGEESEGIVIRQDDLGIFKVKLRHNVDAAIIGFSEGQDDRKGMLHDLLVAVVRADGTFHELTRVGGGFTESDRREFVTELKKRTAPSDYVAVNNDYVAYEMIKPGPVIEISCLDMIAERARGGPVNRMVLQWDGKRYKALSRMPLVSVISPQYVRRREDKEANAEDVSISQVSDLVNVADVERSAVDMTAEPSELLERTVYTKVMAGRKMVRKLLMWKTNKESDPEFPPYVVYLTDFSPNRKTPLERTIKIASTATAARRMFDDLAKKNFIGGWEKVD